MKSSEQSVEQALSILTQKSEKVRRSRSFTTSVLSISEDHSSVKVKLCTGSIIDVPTSILKNVTHLGTVTSGAECLNIACGEIDVSTDVGRLFYQMANEISSLSRSLEATREGLRSIQGTDINRVSPLAEEPAAVKLEADISPTDTVLPEQVAVVQWNGIAGDPFSPYFVFYQAPANQYISQWSIIGLFNCFLKGPPVIGSIDPRDGKTTGLQFMPDAAHGTPIGTRYSGAIKLSVVLVQRTT